MRIEIPFKTPTINHLYGQRGFRKFLTKEAKDLRLKIKECVALAIPREIIWPKKIRVTTFIYEDWMYKNGEVAKKDIGNREKFLIDSIFEELGLDDKYIFEHLMVKVQDYVQEKAIILIEPI